MDAPDNRRGEIPYPDVADYGRMALHEPGVPWDGIDDGAPEGRCTERHLQCVWYSDRLRPASLRTDSGEAVEVESCGRWNLEAGPDFIDAVIRVGPERRRLAGDVEVHIRSSGWTAHRHAGDPRYANVVLHVTFYPGPRPADLPPGVLTVSLRDGLKAQPGFSFDAIDVAAFPHATIPETPRPCQSLTREGPDHAIALLRAAGAYRLELKRRRMRASLRETGDDASALYEAVMAALGYKRNAEAFRRTARALPLSDWTGDRFTDLARLLGVAGLLPEIPPDGHPQEELARRLWDAWWRNSADRPDPPIAWALDGVRPQNSPLRRLAAAAAIFQSPRALADFAAAADPDDPGLAASLCSKIAELSAWPEMEPVYSFTAKEPGKPAALVGGARAAAIVTNALVPFIAALRPDGVQPAFARLPPETTSAPMRLMASRLFGPDHNPRALYENDGLVQQGLLQVYGDFCLDCRTDCAGCAFASQGRLADEAPPQTGH